MALEENALITVEEAQSFGAISSTTNLELLINAVSQAFEVYCGRVFRSIQVVTGTPDAGQAALEYYQGSGRQELRLDRWPITAVERVQIDGEEVTDFLQIPQLLEDGVLWRESGWPIKCAVWPDLTGDPNPDWRNWNIDVAYTGGYSTIPSDLKLACLGEVLSLESAVGRSSSIRSERTPGGYSVTYGDLQQRFDPQTVSVLWHYRRSL